MKMKPDWCLSGLLVAMAHSQILIIGAGTAGLSAAHQLLSAGKKVIILEASARIGGRILDIHNPVWPGVVSLGAEFIHGDLPFTFDLLKQAGLSYSPVTQKSVQLEKGKQSAELNDDAHWDEFMQQLSLLKEDMTLADFIEHYFSGDEYGSLRNEVLRFVQGYDAADPLIVSAFFLRDEWLNEGPQYRVDEGYGKMISFLENKCRAAGCPVYLHKVVTQIHWKKDFAEVICSNKERFTANKLIITAPPGVLRIKEGPGSFIFNPPLPAYDQAVRDMGFGAVIKFALQFKSAFWTDRISADVTFLFSKGSIPTWWMRQSHSVPMLYGWLAGPKAGLYDDYTDRQFLNEAISSLSVLFDLDETFIRSEVVHFSVFNWNTNPYSRGAYGFGTVGGTNAINILKEPVEETLFFAGEAIYEGPHSGTVEAALVSANEVVSKILAD